MVLDPPPMAGLTVAGDTEATVIPAAPGPLNAISESAGVTTVEEKVLLVTITVTVLAAVNA